ncbi:hypothetical protein O3P69_006502 [Scylla paramamosain]|uniref:Uncharacterized protein n=1 Tax=Scylla paramamosain TaxID=85552 RepID=A0AAW0U7K0_SCYPA
MGEGIEERTVKKETLEAKEKRGKLDLNPDKSLALPAEATDPAAPRLLSSTVALDAPAYLCWVCAYPCEMFALLNNMQITLLLVTCVDVKHVRGVAREDNRYRRRDRGKSVCRVALTQPSGGTGVGGEQVWGCPGHARTTCSEAVLLVLNAHLESDIKMTPSGQRAKRRLSGEYMEAGMRAEPGLELPRLLLPASL